MEQASTPERIVARKKLLHIGCGNTRIEGFLNIDCRKTAAADMVAQAWELGAIGDASVEYIYARHMLEHLGRTDVSRALAEWQRVLADGGILHIVVPDIRFHARQLLGLVESDLDDQEAHAMAGFYGWGGDPAAGEHRWGYTPASLANLLFEHGFRLTDGGIAQFVNADTAPWHINLRATPAGKRVAA